MIEIRSGLILEVELRHIKSEYKTKLSAVMRDEVDPLRMLMKRRTTVGLCILERFMARGIQQICSRRTSMQTNSLESCCYELINLHLLLMPSRPLSPGSNAAPLNLLTHFE